MKIIDLVALIHLGDIFWTVKSLSNLRLYSAVYGRVCGRRADHVFRI